MILLLIISVFANAQIVELKKLSTGKFVDGTTLWNAEDKDLYGYFYIFEKDITGKKEKLYEYVLLDKNLNKVFSGEFKDENIINNNYRSFNVRYLNGTILLQTTENLFSQWRNDIRFRLLNVEENKLSDPFVFNAGLEKVPSSSNPKQKPSLLAIISNNPIGYYLNTPLQNVIDYNIPKKRTIENNNIQPKKKYFADEQLNLKWSYEYNQNATKNKYCYTYAAPVVYKDDKNVLVLGKHFVGKDAEKEFKNGIFSDTFIFLDKENGNVLSEISPFGQKDEKITAKDVNEKKIFIKNNIATIINVTSNSKKSIFDEDLIQGFSKAEFDIANGKELNRKYFSWNQISQYVNIDENGYVKDANEPECYMYLHNIIMKEDGNFIFILEEYKPLSSINLLLVEIEAGAKINDMFFMELDKDMKVVKFEKIEKERKTIRNGVKMDGSKVNYYGYFDYAGYQDLGSDNYLFFYYNKQKPENGGKKQWILGIVAYKDGNFTEQKLPMKSEEGSDMLISPAKNGYIKIYETFKDKNKSPEIRLEKINY